MYYLYMRIDYIYIYIYKYIVQNDCAIGTSSKIYESPQDQSQTGPNSERECWCSAAAKQIIRIIRWYTHYYDIII